MRQVEATTYASLILAIEAFEDSKLSAAGGGRFLIGTAGNGQSVSYHVPDWFTPVHQVELAEELHTRYDEAVENIGSDDDDDAIFEEMLGLLNPQESRYHDFSEMRTHAA